MAVEHVLSTYAISTGNPITLTQDFQPGSNPILLVALMSGASNAISATAPSVNGTVMTLAASTHYTQCRTEVWYHKGFASGNITISVPNTLTTEVRVIAGSYKNVDQTSPFTTAKSTYGTSSNATISLTGLTTGGAAGAGFVYGAFTHQAANVATGHSYTSVYDFDEGQWVDGVQHGVVTTADSTVLWGVAASTYWCGVALSLAPALSAISAVPSSGLIQLSAGTPGLTQLQALEAAAGNIGVTAGAARFNVTQFSIPSAGNIGLSCGVPVLFMAVPALSGFGSIVLTCGTAGITQLHMLSVASGPVIVTCGNPVLTQAQALVAGSGNLVITCGVPTVVESAGTVPLTAGNGSIAVTASNPVISQVYGLPASSGNIGLTAGVPALTQVHALGASAGNLIVTCGTVSITQTQALAVGTGAVKLSCGTVGASVVGADVTATPSAGSITVTCGTVTLQQAYHLVVDGGYVNAAVDAIIVEQYHMLSMSDGVVGVTAGTVRVTAAAGLAELKERDISSLTHELTLTRARTRYELFNIDRP